METIFFMRVLLFSFILVLFSAFAQPPNQARQFVKTLDIVDFLEHFTVLSDQLVANLIDEELFSAFSPEEKQHYQAYQKLLQKYYPLYKSTTLAFLKKHKLRIDEILVLEFARFSSKELSLLQLEIELVKKNKILEKQPIVFAKIANKTLDKLAPIISIFALQDPKLASYINVATKIFNTKLAKFKTSNPSDKKQIKECVASVLLSKQNYNKFIKKQQVKLPFFPLNYNLLSIIVSETIAETYDDTQVKFLKDYFTRENLVKTKKFNKPLNKDIEVEIKKLYEKYILVLAPLNQQFLKEPLIQDLAKNKAYKSLKK